MPLDSAGPSDQLRPQVILIGCSHPHTDDVPWIHRLVGIDIDIAIDFRRIGHGTGDRTVLVDLVDQYLDGSADLLLQARSGDRLLVRHETLPALLLDLVRHRLQSQLLRRSTLHRGILETADTVQLRFGQPVEQVLEVLFGLAREADDEGRADGQIRADLTPFADPLQGSVFEGRPLHRFQHLRTGMLEGNIQVRQDLALGHQRDQLVHMGIGIDIVQTHPDAEFAQCLAHLGHAGLDRTTVPETGAVLDIHAIGAGVLGNDQHFLHSSLDQTLRLAQHLAHRPADQLAAHRGNDAEAAAVVAAFGNLQVGVVARGQLDTLRRHQVDQRVVLGARRHHLVHSADYLLVLLGTGYCQYAGVHITDGALLHPHATGDYHPAVLGDGLADGIQGLGNVRSDETAGIDQHHIGALVGGHDIVDLGAQVGVESFGVDECLGAAYGDKPDAGVLPGGDCGFGHQSATACREKNVAYSIRRSGTAP